MQPKIVAEIVVLMATWPDDEDRSENEVNAAYIELLILTVSFSDKTIRLEAFCG